MLTKASLLVASASVIVGGMLGYIGATIRNDDGRDACARLADLRTATTFGDDRSLYMIALDEGGEGLLHECVNGS